jgi:ABC-type branched-subunit amino acid transport system permease subunit
MSKAIIAAVAAVLFLRWLAVGQVTVVADGFPVTVPVLLVAAVIVAAAAAAILALLALRIRAEQARAATWPPRRAGAR